MLPKDIENIINEYNEIGIFIRYRGQLYWFNGKRFEFWCEHRAKYECFLTYNNNLYYKSYKKIYVYKNKIFKQIKIPQQWNHPLNVFRKRRKLINNNVYRYEESIYKMIDTYGNVIMTLPGRDDPVFGFELLGYNDCIYSFGSWQNEKFVNGKWNIIAQYPNHNNDYDVYLFKSKFYAFEQTSMNYYIYDPELDDWKLKIVIKNSF